jgi:hypothetical protein
MEGRRPASIRATPPMRCARLASRTVRHRRGRHQIICIARWHRLVEPSDSGVYQVQHGRSVPLWSDAWRVRHGIPEDRPCPPLPPWFTVHEIPR